MLKERDEPVGDLLRKVAESEEQLEALRQLLNEEIEFSIAQSYLHLKAHHPRVDLGCVREWAGEAEEEAIESVLKYYGQGRLHISQQQWGRMVLTREDQLLAKLARERTHLAPAPLPNYLLNYCRKIWAKECELHRAICAARAAREAIQKWLGWVRGEEGVNEEKLKQFCATISQEMGASCPTTFSRVKSYLLQSSGDGKIQMASLEALLLRNNVPTIQHYLQTKQRHHQGRTSKSKLNPKKNPFLHTEFHRLDQKEDHCGFSFRQLQSIERHISRNKILPTADVIRSRIKEYTAELEKSLAAYFEIVKQVGALASKIGRAKEKLQKEHCCNWKVLFKEMSSNASIVPSEMQHYLQTVQIQLSLQQLFILFKRYADSVTGRMTPAQFGSIFKTAVKPKELTSVVSVEARKAALTCLQKQIKLESKIEQLKRHLLACVDLRDIYDALDQDNDGLVTVTDVEVLCLRITGTRINSQDLHQLWWRMGAKSPSQMLDYQRFMYEMIPRTKQPLNTTK